MNHKTKLLTIPLFAILVAALSPWWGGVSEAAKELRIALQSFDDGTPGLNSHMTPNAQAAMLTSIHEALIEREPYASPLKFRPALATSWKKISPTVWEMKLRKGVKFHDGSIMEAKDVEFTLNRIWKISRPEFSGVQGRFFYNFDRVEVVDPLTVRVHTKKPEPLFEVLLSARNASIVSKEYNEKVGYEKANLMPIGAGPYKVVSFKPRVELVLERFDDYYGEKAPLDRIVFKMVPEISSRITALVNKEVDFITNNPPERQ
jgi:peptide/nickel transport system substrate-binding protein